MSHILSIEQNTAYTRVVIFDENMKIVSRAEQSITQHRPQAGWLEHDPEEIWQSVLDMSKEALQQAKLDASDIVGIGITNQRETTVVWDKHTGKPVYQAIVWQDRRTAEYCRELNKRHSSFVNMRTGLLLDPYFSASKLKWILDEVEGVRERAEAGDLYFGTIDTFLIWRLTGGKSLMTDATNAGRTMLYNIRLGIWDSDLCRLFDVPPRMLPSVKDCAADFGVCEAKHFGAEIPILGVAGDQQAAVIGQACFEEGMMKSTYSTGCFTLLNTGETLIRSENQLLSTIAYQLDGQPTYALEGSIMIAGAVIKWLRDTLNLIDDASITQTLAEQADVNQDVYFVPAFSGLGAPYWDSDCRGAIYGLSANTGAPELCRAALESVVYQTKDLYEAMKDDWDSVSDEGNMILRVDGGMSANDWTMQFLADMLDTFIDRPESLETTAMGVAWLAGMRAGIYPDKETFSTHWRCGNRFSPSIDEAIREKKYHGWQDAIRRTLSDK